MHSISLGRAALVADFLGHTLIRKESPMINKTRKGLTLGLALALAVSIVASPSQAAAASKAGSASILSKAATVPTILRMTDGEGASQAFGPTRNSSGQDQFINSLIFSNLVKVKSDEKTIVPDLATSWVISPDATQFTFTLAKGVKWSDGRPFTADDVIATINMACHFGAPGYLGYQPKQWRLVVGCNDVLGKLNLSASGLTKISDNVVKITLIQPNSQFVRLITDAVYSIIPARYINGMTLAQYAVSPFVVSKPVGTGPYTLRVFKRDQYMSFNANKNYFRGAPKISTVYWDLNVKPENILPMLQKGQLDLAVDINQSLSTQLAKLKNYKAVWNNTTAGQFFQFRADQGMAQNKLVRQAVMYAIDRRGMLKNLFGGHGTIRWVLGGFDQETIPGLDPYPYDPAKAKALLQQSGVDLSQNFEIMYPPDGDPAWPLMVPVMQQQLEAVGLKVTLNPVDIDTYVAKISDPKPGATYALTLNSGGSLGLGASRSSVYFDCKAPRTSFYANCALDQLYLDLFATPVIATQDAIKAKIATILNQDVPFVTIWEMQTLNAVSTRLGGGFALAANDRDSAFNIQDWTLSPLKK